MKNLLSKLKNNKINKDETKIQILYARVSSAEPSENKYTIEVQKKLLENYKQSLKEKSQKGAK